MSDTFKRFKESKLYEPEKKKAEMVKINTIAEMLFKSSSSYSNVSDKIHCANKKLNCSQKS